MTGPQVLVTVLSRQSQEGAQEQVTRFVAEGTLDRQGEALLLTYPEQGEGMEGVLTTLRIEEETVTLLRRGDFRARMTFQEGLRHFFRYVTPYGAVEMAVFTHHLERELTGTEGQLKIVYQLETGPGEAGLMELQIHIREKEPR